jgi:NADPH-dependent methylglyoxal reductase
MAPQDQTLLVTGASGFVGGYIVREALEKGYNVRIVARSEDSAAKALAHYPGHAARLSHAVVPDLTRAESYREALGGVHGVIHNASPFLFDPKDTVRDLLEPAINGSTAVLEAVHRWGPSVTRVVATSSMASIVDLAHGKREGYTYSEKDWNPMSFDEAARADGVTAYCASKALAEKAMWDWVGQNKPAFTLAVICPPWVFGPYAYELRQTRHLSESVGLLHGIIGAEGLPAFDFGGYADNREIAAAHVRAYEVPEAAGQRFLVGQPFRYQLAVDAARAALPELRDQLPEGRPGYVEPGYAVDGSKASRVLGVKYGTLADTIKATYEQLLHAKKVEATT